MLFTARFFCGIGCNLFVMPTKISPQYFFMNDKNPINNALRQIEQNLRYPESWQNCETHFVELKDLSSGSQWKSLNETVCAFLNTEGGYVICGIRETEKRYVISGFDTNNEDNLIKLRTDFFKNDQNILLDLSDNIFFSYHTIEDIQEKDPNKKTKTIAVIEVLPLGEDQKYVKFKETYFERILSADKEISRSRLQEHREYKAELEYAKEISTVNNATIEELDIDKINEFILTINKTGKKETPKKDIVDATNFLIRRYCLKENGDVTLLGLLLFGKDPYQQLESRAEVNCYYETNNQISRDKKYFQDDVLHLMQDAFAFVWGHIKVGRTHIGGGQSTPEFPEKLIREVINNALAHRDYHINQFITIKINPNESIEIKNPGSFKQKMLITIPQKDIRRIIPGVPETKNPKLANILKTFDKIESQGIGMATLVSACLENAIDVPYYDLSIPDSITLVVPSGSLLDDNTARWLNAFDAYLNKKLKGSLNLQHKLVLAYLLKSERNNQQRRYTILLSPNNNHFEVLTTLKKAQLIQEITYDKADQIPVYVIDPTLTIDDFDEPIAQLLQQDLSSLSKETVDILNILYRHNHYNEQAVKPSAITPELYFKYYGKNMNPIYYETLGRKIRKICSDLWQKKWLTKQKNGAYQLLNLSAKEA